MNKKSPNLLLFPLTIFYIYLLYKYLFVENYTSIIDPLNLGIHELGHVVFGFMGMFIGIAGGTMLQLIFPIVGILMFIKQKDAAAILFGIVWLATNFFGIAVYVKDAQEMALPLLSLGSGSDVIHDWNYLLNHTNLILLDNFIGGIFWTMGLLFLVAGIMGNLYLIYKFFENYILGKSSALK